MRVRIKEPKIEYCEEDIEQVEYYNQFIGKVFEAIWHKNGMYELPIKSYYGQSDTTIWRDEEVEEICDSRIGKITVKISANLEKLATDISAFAAGREIADFQNIGGRIFVVVPDGSGYDCRAFDLSDYIVIGK